MTTCRFDAAKFFLVAATLLNICYLIYFPDIFFHWRIGHQHQRLMHVMHLAEDIHGNPDTLPVSMLELIGRLLPSNFINWSSGNTGECEGWPPDVKARYCAEHLSDKTLGHSFSSLAQIPLDPQRRFPFVSNENAAHFPVVGYVPYVAGAWIGLVFGLPPAWILAFAIASNAIFSVVFGYYLLRLLPILQWPACCLLLLPTAFLYRSFIMPDAVTMELCFFAIAWSLNLLHTPRLLSLREKAMLVVLAVLVGLVKVSFFFTPLIYLVIPSSCFGGERKKLGIVAFAVICSVVCSVLWGIYAIDMYESSSHVLDDSRANTRLSAFIAHPEIVIDAVCGLLLNIDRFINNAKMMIAWKVPLSDLQTLFCIGPLFLLACIDNNRLNISDRARMLSFVIYSLNLGAMTAIMFLHAQFLTVRDPWTTAVDLEGRVQGRYFLANLLFLLLALYSIVPLKMRAVEIVRGALIVCAVAGVIYANALLFQHMLVMAYFQ